MIPSLLCAKSSPDLVVYKHADGQDLSLHVFQPSDRVENDVRTAVLVIHGGGWGSGQPGNVYRFARHFAELGYVAISVEYRLYRRGSVEVSDCVKDVRSAFRYVRSHAAKLGVSPSTIIVCGYSAGGHLAIGTALLDDYNDLGERALGPCLPSAVILYSPVLDTSEQGYGYGKLLGKWQEMSPLLNLKPDMPPVFICHSREDGTVPYAGIQKFAEKSTLMGNHCVLVTLEGATHGSVLRDTAFFTQAMAATDGFLRELDLQPTASR